MSLKSRIKALKKANPVIRSHWTKEETEALKELRKEKIPPSVFTQDSEIMEEFFPGRSIVSIKARYSQIKY